MDRVILHCDCNSFYASVETVLDPSLSSGPMAVCGDPKSRHGIILAKNEAAKKYGVQTAETIWQARRKCPGLKLVAPHRDAYAEYSRRVNAIYQRCTDQVEPFGIDESWLDVTGSQQLFGTGKEIADRLREEVRRETGLTISVGVSFNKIFAKLGSDYKKPDATTVISRENWQDMLFPLPVTAMLYVGEAVQRELSGLYISTIGQLAAADPSQLFARLGKHGRQLYDYANGLDDSPVRRADAPREIKSVGNGMTFRRDLSGERELRTGIAVLSDEVAGRLRRYGLCAATIQLQIKDTRLRVISRQRPLPRPTALASELAGAAMELVRASWDMTLPVRMLTVTACNLVEASQASEQLSLFDESDPAGRGRRLNLERTVDSLRGRFGRGIIAPGSVVNNELMGYSQEEEE
ncbi:MAG: DNA polymerase IV [Oscillospiraceae bacterium]|nr:DNA polymerase IV [Oscillospiraceae bacterium]MCM0707847.1 DNA polymerase IV [Faecalicatena sp. BF-R-105]